MPSGQPHHYPGDRAAFAQTRHDIRHVWRNLSDNPAKYDQFVDVGMAAWVESDPYNLWPGQPSGYRTQLPWSNLPMALAYSDEYAWVSSEATHYPATRETLNPFLASIANRTFNTGDEAVQTLAEDFASDPLQHGWYFDFDMLHIGRDLHPEFLPVMTADSVPYAWSSDRHAVRITGAWTTGVVGDQAAQRGKQRRRYVHPLQALREHDAFQATFDFQVESFAVSADNPIVIGVMNSDAPVDQRGINLRIQGAGDVSVAVMGDQQPLTCKLPLLNGGLQPGRTYRFVMDYDGRGRQLRAVLTDTTDSSLAAQVQVSIPQSVGSCHLDEIGAAQWDGADAAVASTEKSYTYWLERVVLTTTE